MGKLEKFVEFAKALPDAQRADVEKLLEDVVDRYSSSSLLRQNPIFWIFKTITARSTLRP